MEDWKFCILGLMGLVAVVLAYCIYNVTLINRNHEALKSELKSRLFFLTARGGQIDLITVMSAFLDYSEVRVEETGGVKIVKE